MSTLWMLQKLIQSVNTSRVFTGIFADPAYSVLAALFRPLQDVGLT